MQLTELIDGLREFLRLEELEPDNDGVYSIVFDDGLDVEILALTDRLMLIRSTVADLPEDKEQHEAFLRQQLQQNLPTLHTQNGSLSLDLKQKVLWLHRVARIDQLDVRQLCELVEDFVNTIEWWRQVEQPAASPMMGSAFPFNMIRP